MHQLSHRLFLLVALIVLFTGCTIEKRLYNKGWSVTSHRSWKQQNGSGAPLQMQANEDDPADAPGAEPLRKKPAVIAAESYTVVATVDSLPDEATSPVLTAVSENEEVTDTIFVDEKDIKKAKNEWTKQRKRNSVVAVAALLLFTALTIAAIFLTLYGPSVTLVATGLLILTAIALGMLFFILLVILLAFVFRRPVDKLSKEEVEMTPRQKRNQDIKNWILVSVAIAAGIFVLYKLFEQ